MDPQSRLFQNLKTLKMQNCTWLTIGCLEAVTLHQFALEDLDLGRSLLYSSPSINCFFRKFPNLKNINLERNQITDSTLVVISEVCKNLENINITFCPHLTDYGIRSLLQLCPRLKSIMMRGCVQVSPHCVRCVPTAVLIDLPRTE